MNVQEQTLQIAGDGFDMLGILSLPTTGQPVQHTGVVIVVGGAQYRVGSHRQFVRLARHLAGAGYPVLRFDLPGMGDSPGESVTFEETARHIAAAIDAMQTAARVDNTVLWGLCDGASASLLYMQATQDPRVSGLALLNPWVRSEVGLARARVKHYYRQRLLESDFWRKLVAGGVGLQAVRGLWANMLVIRQRPQQQLTFQERMAQGQQAFKGKTLLLLSERDLTAQEFVDYTAAQPSWRKTLQCPSVSRHSLVGADHTCSLSASQLEAENLTLAWLTALTETLATLRSQAI